MQCPVRRESRLREHSHSDWQTVTSAWARPRRPSWRADRLMILITHTDHRHFQLGLSLPRQLATAPAELARRSFDDLITHTDHQHFQLGLGLPRQLATAPAELARRSFDDLITHTDHRHFQLSLDLPRQLATAPAELACRSFDDLITDTDHWHFQLGLGQSPATQPRTEA